MTTADTLGRAGSPLGGRRGRTPSLSCRPPTGRSPLEPEDLERLATAAYLVGRDADSIDIWTRAHHEFLRRGDVQRAARCAFWLAFILLNKGELVRGGGWVARARRLLDDGQRDCVEQGYLLWGVAARSIFEGDSTSACATFARAVEIGERFGDRDLVTLARVGQSRALLRLGETAAGWRCWTR